jgi:hypothetical protein
MSERKREKGRNFQAARRGIWWFKCRKEEIHCV